jgi:hypothetical protein
MKNGKKTAIKTVRQGGKDRSGGLPLLANIRLDPTKLAELWILFRYSTSKKPPESL